MAERRMFSKRIINSARFLKMPISSQCLYFHLGLHADDDGVVEAYTVMNSLNASEDDIRVLVAKGFVHILNEDLVAYITDWNENNKIRADRKIDSFYKELLLQVLPDVQIKQKRIRADVAKKNLIDGQPTDNQWTTNGQPMDSTGKVRLGQDRLSQDSSGKENILSDPNESEQPKPSKPIRHKYGEYKNVLLSDDDLAKLKNEFPSDYDDRIERLSSYIASTGKVYKNHLATIRMWAKKDKEQKKQAAPSQQPCSNPFLAMAMNDKGG